MNDGNERERDLHVVLARRHDQGADFWATPDGRIYVGNPFSTISSLGILHELGLDRDHEAVQGGIELLLSAIREDGCIRIAPKAPMYPCYTAEAVRMLCRFGLADTPDVTRVLNYLTESEHDSGGWRCSFSRFGKGPETTCASPGATLYALDALRFAASTSEPSAATDRAVEFLLQHWDTRTRIGPCHHGIGKRFLRVEFPFIRYNLFYYVYVLSFYEHARGDGRFLAALSVLRDHLDGEERMVVDHPHRGLRGLTFCAKGKPSTLATRRFREICDNLEGGAGSN